MIVINFKNYKTGISALELAKQVEKYIPKAIICPSTIDIETISQKTKLKVFAQNIDYAEGKRATGFLLPETVKEHGGKGTLLNHSEHKVPFYITKKIMQKTKENKLKVILCASSLNNVKKFIPLKPYAIAFEDPKLIATGKSITKYNSKALKDFVQIMKKTKIIPLCGAGISAIEDIEEAYRFGCKGVLIASAIANSKNPIPLLKQIRKF